MKSEKGFGLIEVLIGVAILAMVGVAFFGSLTLSSRILLNTEIEEKAKDLAASKIEDVLNTPWSTDYTSLNSSDSNFTIVINTPESLSGGNLQKVTVVVKNGTKTITTLEAYKVKPDD
jgi:prepilin-type N-terminal cleavage/methylation domain-containing protein